MSANEKAKTSLAVAAVVLLSFAGNGAMAQQGASVTPSIVFVGTVETLKAVTLPNVTVTSNTSVVAVDRVIKKPDAIALDTGDKVTVVTDGGAPLQEGAQGLFFTDGLIFGESLAVRVLSWEPVLAAAAGAAEDTRVSAQVGASADRELQTALESADLVVVGRVKRVQAPSALALAPERRRVTEHDPEWREAIIEVESALKGAADLREVVVRFPASVDVMWAASPKFTEGQEGTFLLQQDRLTGAPAAVLDGRPVSAYTAVSPKHVLSSGDAARIKTLLGK
ncbi:hypothetical protein [Bradyrhizobium sp.]|jgi:hypothetical protein|uniref:hypothetical protein n=1 Tax=Bradyrhizobium sp. TaxID=376 RepID=UPI002E0806C6|nr:hypothetical protein [Bradyrhizobium sp.]